MVRKRRHLNGYVCKWTTKQTLAIVISKHVLQLARSCLTKAKGHERPHPYPLLSTLFLLALPPCSLYHTIGELPKCPFSFLRAISTTFVIPRRFALLLPFTNWTQPMGVVSLWVLAHSLRVNVHLVCLFPNVWNRLLWKALKDTSEGRKEDCAFKDHIYGESKLCHWT